MEVFRNEELKLNKMLSKNLNTTAFKIFVSLVVLFICYYSSFKTGYTQDGGNTEKKLFSENHEKNLECYKTIYRQYKKCIQHHDYSSKSGENKSNQKQFSENQNILDECYHVYLDIGSNIGVQVRKLFEPEKYPGAKIHKIFDREFGNIQIRRQFLSQRKICAVGFEPNHHHTNLLKKIEERYNNCGWKVFFMTETAVSNRNGTTVFYTDKDFKNLEWGGGILPPSINKISQNISSGDKNKYQVKLIRLSKFIKDVVGKRKLPVKPTKLFPPKVVMKIDIEGSELDVIPDILFTGGLEYIDTMMVEWHAHLETQAERSSAHSHLKSSLDAISNYAKAMINHSGPFNFKVVELDDESYATSKFELPDFEAANQNCSGK